MASFCGDCGGRPRRQAGWGRRDCLSPDQMGGWPGVALTQSSTIICSIHLEGRNRKTLAKWGRPKVAEQHPSTAHVSVGSIAVAELRGRRRQVLLSKRTPSTGSLILPRGA